MCVCARARVSEERIAMGFLMFEGNREQQTLFV